jgi:hypothetical protein
MLGFDISWAAFNVIEVMSSTKFTHKVCNCQINIRHDLMSNICGHRESGTYVHLRVFTRTRTSSC